MQEEVLSRRLLAFVDNQIYYRCQEEDYAEIMNSVDQPVKAFDTQLSIFAIMLREEMDFRNFSTVILYYGIRQLSYERDTLRAAQGMLRRYATLSGKKLFEGLPAPLDQSLLFNKHRFLPRSASISNRRRAGFPSYSWAGWRDVVSWDLTLDRSVPIPDSKLSKAIATQALPEDYYLRTWISWHYHVSNGTFKFDFDGNATASRGPTIEGSFHGCRPEFCEVDIHEDNPDVSELWRVNSAAGIVFPLLLFWTICVDLNIIRASKDLEAGCHLYDVLDDTSQPCGNLRLDTDPLKEETSKETFALVAQSSEGTFWGLFLKWDQNGLAERRGLAELPIDVLKICLQPGPRWRRIVLG